MRIQPAIGLALGCAGLLVAILVGAAPSGAPADPVGPPSIVLISIDTLRADRLGAFGGAGGLSPNLDAFAAEATVFTQTYSQAVQTAPSHTSLFTSRYPSEQVGSDRQPYVPPGMPLLAEVLQLYGYHTGAFVGGADLSLYRALNIGFDAYETSIDFGSLWHTSPLALQWLDALPDDDAPFFLFVHGYDTHSRYLKPTPFGYAHADRSFEGPGQRAVRTTTERIIDGVLYRDFAPLLWSYEMFLRPRLPENREQTKKMALAMTDDPDPLSAEDAAVIAGVYDGAVGYADTMFGLLMASLQDRGVLDEAYVIVLSDHGEQLGERGIYGHCCEANDEETHVPLMIRAPRGEGAGRRVDGFVELVDVMPTVLELAQAREPATMRGRSLTAALRGEPFVGRPYAFTEGTETMRVVSMRAPEVRLSYVGLSATSALLPDLIAAAPLESRGFQLDGAGAGGVPAARQAELRGALVDWLRGLSPPPIQGKGKKKAMPSELKQALKEHGYWDLPE